MIARSFVAIFVGYAPTFWARATDSYSDSIQALSVVLAVVTFACLERLARAWREGR